MGESVRGEAKERRPGHRHAGRGGWMMLAGALGLCACEQLIGADFGRASFDPGGSTGEGAGPGGGADGEPCTPGDQESCYEGPEGSQDVGVCAAGVRACGGDGVWGPCEGQILPGVEDTSTPGDENCDRMTGSCQWATAIHGSIVHHMAVDASGASYIAGSLVPELGPENRLADWALFLAKITPDGLEAWRKNFGEPDTVLMSDVIGAHADGGVIVGGSIIGGPVDLGGCSVDPGASASGAFIARFDAEGECMWSRLVGGDGGLNHVLAVSAKDPGRMVVAGECALSVEIGGLVAPCAGGEQDGFVAMLDGAAGDVEWIRTFGGTGTDRVWGLDMDADGDVFATLQLKGVVDLDGAALGTAGWTTAAIAKLDRVDGEVRWAKGLGYFNDSGRVAPAVDAQGNVVVVTSLAGILELGKVCKWKGVDGVDVAVARLDTNGGCHWARNFVALGEQVPMSVAVDPEGSIIIGGYYKAPINFDLGFLPLRGSRDAFLLKLGPDHQTLWSRSFGDATDTDEYTADISTGVGVDAAGYVHVTGRFDGTVDFCDDGQGLVNTGADLFLARYAP